MRISEIPENVQVTVIGAGPAGALAAVLLARRNVDVLLVDKSAFPRSKVCGCCLSGAAMRSLRQAGLQRILDEAFAVPLNRLRVRTQTTSFAVPLQDSFALSRLHLDNALVREAESAGARFLPGTTASVEHVGEHFASIKLDGEDQTATVASKIVLVADGVGGNSLKHIEAFEPHVESDSRIGVGACLPADTLALTELPLGTIDMHYGPGAYVGMVRLEDGSIDIAAALDPALLKKSHSVSAAIAEVLRTTDESMAAILAACEWRGTAALSRRRLVSGKRVFVLGDAASYIEPFTGEGIAWALSSAETVAPLAEKAALIWRQAYADQWQSEHERVIGRRQRTTAQLAWLLKHPFLSEASANVLHLMPTLGASIATAVRAGARA